MRSLVLYEPPLHGDRLDPSLIVDVKSALDAGNPDRALELFFPDVGIIDQEVQILRSLDPVWARLREGVQLVPREIRAFEGREQLMAFDSPDVPTLYLYGEETEAPIFATLDEVAELFPKAQLHGLPGQRHLGFAFDPTVFAQAILDFTTAHDA
jgi:pimeloyl-ACP methyl ester carboxylesterase